MQQSGIKRFFSQSAVKTPGSTGGNSGGQGPDATPSQKPVKRPRVVEIDTDENNSNSNIHQAAQTPAAVKPVPSVARTSFLQSAEANLKSAKPAAARTSYTLTTPALQSARAHTVAVSTGIHGQHTATTGTPGAERGEKLQKRLACDPEGDSELKKIEEKFKWLHSQNRRDSKGRTSQDLAYDGGRTIQIPEASKSKLSGSQKQYWEVKAKYLDVMIFFKVGKFYELYEEDAAVAYEVLGYKVTVSGVGRCRQAGVPESGLQQAMAALVAAGYKVGVMEQIETGEEAKKRAKNAIVRRKLVNVETPATALEPTGTESVHLLSVRPVQAIEGRTVGGMAFAVLNAAECTLMVGFFREDALGSALSTLLAYTAPAEVLIPGGPSVDVTARRVQAITPTAHISKLPPDESPDPHKALQVLAESSKHGTTLTSIREHVAEGDVPAVAAAVLPVLQHVKRMCLDDKLQDAVLQVQPFSGGLKRMRLDCTALTNLEVLQGSTGMRSGSLLDVLDTCVSVSGKRLIRAWLSQPLCDVDAIKRRQNAVRDILASSELMTTITDGLRGLPDMDRAVGRVRTALAQPSPGLPLQLQRREQQRRLNALRSALQALQQSLQLLRTVSADVDAGTVSQPALPPLLVELCASAPDESHDACELLSELPKTVCMLPVAGAAAGRKSQGRSSKKSVEQLTLSLSDDMFPDLAEALDEETRLQLEAAHVSSILSALLEQSEVWQAMSVAMSSLDVLAALARFAQHDGGATCFPEFVRDSPTPELDCKGLWHPALAATSTSPPIPTNLNVGSQSGAALLLTGPNMGGKSTLLRATSTAVIFAHIGAPVPASACRLTPVDAIFTRLGASDSILQDELGRGTSTFDGYSIAAAVFGHLVQAGCRLLFATHYHPLTDEFSQAVPGVQLGHMGAEFSTPTPGHSHGRVFFKYKLQSGACPKSYGLHVAALAGIPPAICKLADQVGSALESRLSRCFRNSTIKEASLAATGDAAQDSDSDFDDVALFSPQVARVFQAAKDGSLPDVQRDLKRLLPALGAL